MKLLGLGSLLFAPCSLLSQQTTLLFDVGDNTLKRPTAAQFRAANLDASYQPLDADLTSWAAVTRASGFDTFTATPSSANLDSLVTDDTGSGSLVFATSPTLVTPVLGAATATSINSLSLSATGGSLSVAIGNTGAAAAWSVAIGNTASITSTETGGVALGYGATISGSGGGQNMALGHAATASAYRATAIGYSTTASGVSSLAIGRGAVSNATHGIAIGRGSYLPSTYTNDVTLGFSGGSTPFDVWFENGWASIYTDPVDGGTVSRNATTLDIRLHGVDGFDAAAGTSNIAGGNLIMAAGVGSGTGAGGAVKIQSSVVGASGATKNSLADMAVFSPSSGIALTPLGTKQVYLSDTASYLLVRKSSITSTNGAIQLPDHTTADGGVGLGTDVSLYRTAAGRAAFSGANARLALIDTSAATAWSFRSSAGFLTITHDTAAVDGVRISGSAAATGFFRVFYTTEASAGGGSIIADGGISAAKKIIAGTDVVAGGAIITTPQSLSGAGAVNVTTTVTEYTSTGGAQALTLANGTVGQHKYIVHTVDGGSGVLTPTTKIGFTTITFTNVGDSVTLIYTTTGWAIVGIFGAVAA